MGLNQEEWSVQACVSAVSVVCLCPDTTPFIAASIPIADTFYESQPRNGGTPVYNGGYTIDTTMNWSPIG
eukprot:3540691-Rhodomonas_salina.3